MKALFIILCVAAFIFCLLILPVTADVSYNKKFVYRFKYSGIVLFNSEKRFDISKFRRKKKSKTSKKTEKEVKSEKENFFKKTYKEKGFVNTVKYFAKISGIILKRVLHLLKRFKFKKFKLKIIYASDDAASTAIEYGGICCAIYPIIALLETTVNLKTKEINISADFDKTEPEFEISVSVTAHLINFIIAFVAVMLEILKLQRKDSENQ